MSLETYKGIHKEMLSELKKVAEACLSILINSAIHMEENFTKTESESRRQGSNSKEISSLEEFQVGTSFNA